MEITVSYTADTGFVPLGSDRLLPRRFTLTKRDADSPEPGLQLLIEVQDGYAQCREIRISSQPDGREVQPKDLRAIKLDDWIEYASMQIGLSVMTDATGLTTISPLAPEDVESASGVRRMVQSARRDARRRVSDELLREVAEVYRKNVGDRPTEAVAKHFRKAHRTAGLYVKLAREAGYLGASVRGKAGERPTSGGDGS